MAARAPETDRPLRADAARNRARIVAAARSAFAEKGVAVGVDEIADRAGVGMGTLYRRFPTKDSLVLAILDERLDALAADAEQAAALEPAAALEAFMLRTCLTKGEDRGLLPMLSAHLGDGEERAALRRRYLGVLQPLVDRARAAGVVRDDLDAEDLAVLLHMLATGVPGAPGTTPTLSQKWERYLHIVLAGVRP